MSLAPGAQSPALPLVVPPNLANGGGNFSLFSTPVDSAILIPPAPPTSVSSLLHAVPFEYHPHRHVLPPVGTPEPAPVVNPLVDVLAHPPSVELHVHSCHFRMFSSSFLVFAIPRYPMVPYLDILIAIVVIL